MTIVGVELHKIEHAEAAKDPGRATALWEGVAPAGIPTGAGQNIAVIVQVIASDGLDPVEGFIDLFNATTRVGISSRVFGLSVGHTIASDGLAFVPGDLIQVRANPADSGAVWVDRATVTFSTTALAATTPHQYGPPAQVSALTAIPGDGLVDLSWPHAVGVERTSVRYRATGAATWTTTPWLPVTTQAENTFVSTATVSGLTNGTQYEFQVAHQNDSGFSPWSDTTTATPAGTTGPAVWDGFAWDDGSTWQ